MTTLYLLVWGLISHPTSTVISGIRHAPSTYMSEAQALAAAFRALSCGFEVERIERPDGSTIVLAEIKRRFARTRG